MSTAEPEPALPYVIHGGERRYLALLHTPRDHPMRALPGWEEATGITPIPRSEWPSLVFERRHADVPILDQDGQGACTAFAHAASAMILRSRSGAPYVPLSANFLYTLVDGGYDQGSNAGDAIRAMQSIGIAPADLVPGRPIRPSGVNAAAMAAAARFKLQDAIPLTTFDEVVTAAYMGYMITFDVAANGQYETDVNGTVNYLGPYTDHEQCCGEGLRLVNGNMQVLGRNSWNASWGDGGWGWFQMSHFQASNSLWAMKTFVEDPQDADLPPVLLG